LQFIWTPSGYFIPTIGIYQQIYAHKKKIAPFEAIVPGRIFMYPAQPLKLLGLGYVKD